MRADRLLSIVLLLQARQGEALTAGEIARSVEVSERTVYRDIEALSAAGVPVYSTRGPNGGISLIDGWRTDLSGLTADESVMLFLLGFPVGDLGLGANAAALVMKLLATLPPAQRVRAERARSRLLLDAPGWMRSTEAVPHLPAILDALLADRCISARYRSRRRELEPWGLVVKAGIWYLVAGRSESSGVSASSPATYRVSRFASVEPLDRASSRPSSFDLGRFWSEWTAEFEGTLRRVKVEVRVRDFLIADLPRIFGDAISAAPGQAALEADGWASLRLAFESMQVAASRLLGLGDAVEVVTPRRLRTEIATRAAAVVALYGRVG